MNITNQNDHGTTSARRIGAFLLAATLLAAFAPASEPPNAGPGRRIPVLILTGQSNTDWRWTSTHLRGLLEDSGKFDVEISVVPEGTLSDALYLQRFKLFLVDYAGFRWGEPAETNFLEAVKRGTGVVAIGNAVAAFDDWKEYEELIGFHCGADAYLTNFQRVKMNFTDAEHPIAKGYGGLKAHSDQLAVGLELAAEEEHQVIATIGPAAGGEQQPALVVGKYGEGRVFATPLGHVTPDEIRTWVAQSNPAAEQLFLRVCEWAATGEVSGLRRLAPNTLTETDRLEGWKLLFDGNSAQGWGSTGGGGFPADQWNAEGGVLRVLPDADRKGIATVSEYRQFELELEWKVEGEGGSNLNLLGSGAGGSSFQLGGSASDYGTSSTAYILRPVGEFNHARVVATFGKVEHWLNGVKIATFYNDPAEWARGVTEGSTERDPQLDQLPLARIRLENEGVGVCFRNIKIRRLPLPVPHVAPPPTPTIELFNGRDLKGWNWIPEQEVRNVRGAFEVQDGGLLVGAGQPLGQLQTAGTYKNFELELDWRFNPTNKMTGEGGVFLRTVGEDTQFPDGIEVKLDFRQAGAIRRYGRYQVKLDPRRQNGDYGRPIQLTEHRPGEWNHLKIRFDRGDLLVRVNGEVVNTARLAAERAGVIGLVTRRVEIQFRDVRVRSLD